MDQQSSIQKTILDKLGLSNLPQDKKEKLLIKMTAVILKRIFLETMERLNEEGRKEYENLVENQASPEQLEDFLKSKIENYEAMVQKVIEDFKAEMRANI